MLARNTGIELLERRVCKTLSSRFAANDVSRSSRSHPPFHCEPGESQSQEEGKTYLEHERVVGVLSIHGSQAKLRMKLSSTISRDQINLC
jgi:hypothetical protein